MLFPVLRFGREHGWLAPHDALGAAHPDWARFLEHGTGKLLGFPAGLPFIDKMPAGLLYFTGTMELIGGVLIMLGLVHASGRLHPLRLHGGRPISWCISP